METINKLLTLASWLENPENELIVSAEKNETLLKVVAKAVVTASEALKQAAEEIDKERLDTSDNLTEEKLEELAALANILDETGDSFFMKQASLIDEILVTLAAPKNSINLSKEREEKKIEELKKKYEEQSSGASKEKIADAEKVVKSSPLTKKYRILEAPLSTRTCPDHPGAQIARVEDHIWQCSLDKKIYNFETGFETLKGNIVPGGSVDKQTPLEQNFHTTFDTRESKLNK